MTGTDELRGQEYSSLMSQASDLGRTSQLCWTGAAVAAAALLSWAIGANQPGMLLPVELCAASGFYATVHARRQCRLLESYLREYHEIEPDGAQWCTRLAQLASQPGSQDPSEWLPLPLANGITLVAVVFSWVFAKGAAHGELMAGIVTMAGVAFSTHSIVETMHLNQAQSPGLGGQVNTGLREVTAVTKRVRTAR